VNLSWTVLIALNLWIFIGHSIVWKYLAKDTELKLSEKRLKTVKILLILITCVFLAQHIPAI